MSGNTRQQLKFKYLQEGHGRINHWVNQANARGLTLKYENTPLLVFHVFSLFTTRQNCRAFWLLCLVYRLRKLTTVAFIVFKWLERSEPNRTTLYDPINTSKSVHPWTSAEIFPGWGQRRNIAYTFQVADDAMQVDVHKTLYPSTPLVFAGWTSVLNLLSEMFFTLRLSEML